MQKIDTARSRLLSSIAPSVLLALSAAPLKADVDLVNQTCFAGVTSCVMNGDETTSFFQPGSDAETFVMRDNATVLGSVIWGSSLPPFLGQPDNPVTADMSMEDNSRAGRVEVIATGGDASLRMSDTSAIDGGVVVHSILGQIGNAGDATVVLEDQASTFGITTFSEAGDSNVLLTGSSVVRSSAVFVTLEGDDAEALVEVEQNASAAAGIGVISLGQNGNIQINARDNASGGIIDAQNSVSAEFLSGLGRTEQGSGSSFIGLSGNSDFEAAQARVYGFGTAQISANGSAITDYLIAQAFEGGTARVEMNETSSTGAANATADGAGSAFVVMSGDSRADQAGSVTIDGDASFVATGSASGLQFGAVSQGLGDANVEVSENAHGDRINALATGSGDANLTMDGSAYSMRAASSTFGGGNASIFLDGSAVSDTTIAETLGSSGDVRVTIVDNANAGIVFAEAASGDAVIENAGTAQTLSGTGRNVYVMNSRSGLILGNSSFTADDVFSFVNEGEVFGGVASFGFDGDPNGTIRNAGSFTSSGEQDLFLIAARILNEGSVSSANGFLDRIDIVGVYEDAGGSVVIDVDFLRGADLVSVEGAIEGVMRIDLVDITEPGADVGAYLSRIDISELIATDPATVTGQQVAINRSDAPMYDLRFEETADGEYRWYLALRGPSAPPLLVLQRFELQTPIHASLVRAMHERSFGERRAVADKIEGGADFATDFRITNERVTMESGLRDSFRKIEVEQGFNISEDDNGTLIGNVTLFHGKIDAGFADQSISRGIASYVAEGYGSSVGLTWLKSGFYVDGKIGVNRYSLDFADIEDEGSASGANLNFEMGSRFELDDGWTVTPSAQFSITSVKTKTFEANDGTTFVGSSTTNRRARIGLNVGREWTDNSGAQIRAFATVDALSENGGELSRGNFAEVGLGGSFLAKDSAASFNAMVHAPVSGSGKGNDLRASLSATWRF